jgi:ethanolamine-phosphate phospho-lyase
MEEWIKTRFDFHSLEIKRLNGYDNANYLLDTEKGKFILKTYPYSLDTFDLVQAETDILLALQHKFVGRISTQYHS